MKSSGIVELERYNTLIEANVAKTKLDAYGVACFLSDEHMGSLFPNNPTFFSDIRLFVLRKDVLQARNVLASTD